MSLAQQDGSIEAFEASGDEAGSTVEQPPAKRQKLTLENHQHRYGTTSLSDHSRAHFGNSYTHNHYYEKRPEKVAVGHDEDSKARLLSSLLFVRMDARLRNIRSPLPKTCEWIFQHSYYKKWIDLSNDAAHEKFLWIKGKPGCGKSTIIKKVFSRVKAQAKKNGLVTISYFFNARAPDLLEKSSLGLYRSLLHQLLTVMPQLLDLFFEQFSAKLLADDIDWEIEELQEFLIEAISHEARSPICIFIDALDEGDENDIRSLLDFLETLQLHVEEALPLRICLSSRHYPQIDIKRGLRLVMENHIDHVRDIEMYVREKMPSSASLDEVRGAICSKSEGIFLWVVMVIPMLKQLFDQGKGKKAMMKTLHSLPTKLEDLFAEILARDSKEINACVALFQCMLYSFRPLNPIELYTAILYSQYPPRTPGRGNHQELDTAEGVELNNFFNHNSRGLVELTTAEPQVVQFIHETVREFLCSERGLLLLDVGLGPDLEASSHATLTRVCLRYFQTYVGEELPPVASKSAIQLYCDNRPLIRYVIIYMLNHADAAWSAGLPQSSCLDFLTREDGCINQWWLHLQACVGEQQRRKLWGTPTVLCVCVRRELSCLLTASLRTAVTLSQSSERHQDAILAACEIGNEKILREMLEGGIQIDTTFQILKKDALKHPLVVAWKRKHFSTALSVANHIDTVPGRIVDFLLHNVSPTMAKVEMEIVTRAACVADMEEMRALLRRYSLQGDDHALALILPFCDRFLNCSSPRPHVFSKFFSTDNGSWVVFGSALAHAILGRKLSSLKLLLGAGASMSTVASLALQDQLAPRRQVVDKIHLEGASLLCIAVALRWYEGVVFLLQHCSSINELSKDKQCPLSIAYSAGDERIFDLLLKHGAKIPDGCDIKLVPSQRLGIDRSDMTAALHSIGVDLPVLLHDACTADLAGYNYQFIRQLLNLKVDPHTIVARQPNTAFAAVILSSSYTACEALLDAGISTTPLLHNISASDLHTYARMCRGMSVGFSADKSDKSNDWANQMCVLAAQLNDRQREVFGQVSDLGLLSGRACLCNNEH